MIGSASNPAVCRLWRMGRQRIRCGWASERRKAIALSPINASMPEKPSRLSQACCPMPANRPTLTGAACTAVSVRAADQLQQCAELGPQSAGPDIGAALLQCADRRCSNHAPAVSSADIADASITHLPASMDNRAARRCSMGATPCTVHAPAQRRLTDARADAVSVSISNCAICKAVIVLPVRYPDA